MEGVEKVYNTAILSIPLVEQSVSNYLGHYITEDDFLPED